MKKSEVEDLKDFISVLLSQQIDLLRGEFNAKFDAMDQKINQLNLDIGDAVISIQESNDKILGNHEIRITKLEKATT